MGLFNMNVQSMIADILPPVVRSMSFGQKNVGGFVVFDSGDPSTQYIDFLIRSVPGSWKEFPPVGVNIFRFLNGTESPQVIERAIKTQLEKDVFDKPVVDITDFPIIVVNAVVFEL